MTYILYNPKANAGNGTAGLDKVTQAIRAKGAEPETVDITVTDVRSFIAGRTENDAVILCGGDGTLHHFVNAIAQLDITVPIYVWRMGTGNDFLRDVGGKKDAPVRLNEYLQNLPWANVNGQRVYFLNNVCFGLDGQVCELGEQEKERLGRRVNYVGLAIRLALRDYRLTSAAITVDGVTKHYDKVWLASALNGRYVGGGMKLAPDQDRKSDRLCCVIMRGTGRLYLLSRLASVYWGGHKKLKCVEMLYGNDIHVVFDAPTALNMDGEVISGVTEYRAVKYAMKTEKTASPT